MKLTLSEIYLIVPGLKVEKVQCIRMDNFWTLLLPFHSHTHQPYSFYYEIANSMRKIPSPFIIILILYKNSYLSKTALKPNRVVGTSLGSDYFVVVAHLSLTLIRSENASDIDRDKENE